MIKTFMAIATILFALNFVTNANAANDNFTCKCIAKGSGVDNKEGLKICSYSCSCNGFNKNEAPILGAKVSVTNVVTSAKSRDSWDSGSSICHGQYAYKSNLGDPNWKIQVRFSPFNVTSYSDSVVYDEADQAVDAAIGVKYYLKRTLNAPEVVQSIREQF